MKTTDCRDLVRAANRPASEGGRAVISVRKPPSAAKRLKLAFPAFYDWQQDRCDVLALPMPPSLANNASRGSNNFWARANAKQAYREQCETLASHGLLPPPPAMPPERARVRVAMHVKRIHDHDNAVARLKSALDFLVAAGYLKDDKPAHCDLLMPTQVKVTKGDGPPRIEFEIEVL